MKPNFLFLFPDQHRGDWMPYDEKTKKILGVSDLELKMPNIKKLMENGTTFTRAFSSSPLCAPARACLASGMRYNKCRVIDNSVNYDENLPTFYNQLKECGYNVGAVGKLDLNKPEYYWGEKGWRKQLENMGFTTAKDNEGKLDGAKGYLMGEYGIYLDKLEKAGYAKEYSEDMVTRKNDVNLSKVPDELYCDNYITKNGIEMINNFEKNKPWFIQVNFAGPHSPWDITQKMFDTVKNRKFPMPCEWTRDEDIIGIRKAYAAMIENIDKNIGLLIDTVKQRGELENTVIVYCADHGEMLGDHDMFSKSNPLQGSVSIPLVIDACAFNAPKNRINESPVELQDLAATFLDFAETKFNVPNQSRSIKDIVMGKSDKSRNYAVSEFIIKGRESIATSFCTAFDGRYKLIISSNNKDRLYDLLNDPFEQTNIAEKNPLIVKELKLDIAQRNKI